MTRRDRRCGGRLGGRFDDRGGVLIAALIFTMVGGILSAALLTFSLGASSNALHYQSHAQDAQGGASAVDLAIAGMRRDRSYGTAGAAHATSTWTTDIYTATCTAQPGSGAGSAQAGYADRTVTCTATGRGRTLVRAQVRFFDHGGYNPGASVEILSWSQ